MNEELKKYLSDFLEQVKKDIAESSHEFNHDDFMRIVAASSGFGAFIEKIIEEKENSDDRPLKGKF